MKRLHLNSSLILVFFWMFWSLSACRKDILTTQQTDNHVVPEYFARTIAEKFNGEEFFKQIVDTSKVANTGITAVPFLRHIKNSHLIQDKNKTPALYIFNYADSGFVFVSAEFTLQPILAYVPKGEVKIDTVPAGLVMWMEKTVENIEILRDGKYDNSKTGIAAWNYFINDNSINVPFEVRQALSYFSSLSAGSSYLLAPSSPDPDCDTWYTNKKGPLLPVTWGQGCTYNDLIKPGTPYNCSLSCGNDRPWTGCVATAMAQIIRYWKSSPFYDYNAMLNDSGSYDVQKLMYQIGLYVDMDWGCDASSANGGKIDNALKAYFGINSVDRIWNDLNIYNTTYDNLKKGWPVLLGGCRDRHDYFFFHIPYNCHEWICDGFYESFNVCFGGYKYFHMNWGWHEVGGNTDYNGWFGFYNWNIPVINYNYRYYHDAFVNIHP